MSLSLKELIQLKNKSLEEQQVFLKQKYPKVKFEKLFLNLAEIKEKQSLNNTPQTFKLRREENSLKNSFFYQNLKDSGIIKE